LRAFPARKGQGLSLPAMQKIALLAALNLLALLIQAQEKYDYTWILGSRHDSPELYYGGMLVDFNRTPLDIRFNHTGLTIEDAATMSDRDGKLQFYSNGCEIYNHRYELMENGDSINSPGYVFDGTCPYRNGYNTYAGMMPLPVPGQEGRYVLFHLRFGQPKPPLLNPPPPLYHPDGLLCTEIDMGLNGGAGAVTRKNLPLQKDTFCDVLTAVRHGNGRDWWLAAPTLASDTVYLSLLTPQGIEGPFVRRAPPALPGRAGEPSREAAVFSPDGARFARASTNGGGLAQLFSFDRCAGEFSCPLQLAFPGDTVTAIGAAFSPSGQFLYVSTGLKLYQFDCAAKDVQASKTFIARYDGYKNVFATTFFQQQLGPDGKIYMSCTNGTRSVHVVESPDAKGAACGFRQRGIETPAYYGFSLPRFPNFRLYDLRASPCDSLGIDAPSGAAYQARAEGLRVFPNPATGAVRVVAPCCAWGSVRVHTAAGALVREFGGITDGENIAFDVGGWPAGVYFVSAMSRAHGVVAARLVVQRE
jgi:hypothetical protein